MFENEAGSLKSHSDSDNFYDTAQLSLFCLQVIAWLKGSGGKWLKEEHIQIRASKSATFSKGKTNDFSFWSRLIKQAISLNLIDIECITLKFYQIRRVVRRFGLNANGHTFIAHPIEMLLPKCSKQERGSSNKKSKKSKNEGLHYIPRIKEMLQKEEEWKEITCDEHLFPGFPETNNILFCQNWKELALTAVDANYLIKDCQLSTNGYHTTRHKLTVKGEQKEVFVKRGKCEGVKICEGKDCTYRVSRSQRKNRCPQHGMKQNLSEIGSCPANIIYIIPVEDQDFQRWVIITGTHNHPRPSPHTLPTLLRKDIEETVRGNPSITAAQLQKGTREKG